MNNTARLKTGSIPLDPAADIQLSFLASNDQKRYEKTFLMADHNCSGFLSGIHISTQFDIFSI